MAAAQLTRKTHCDNLKFRLMVFIKLGLNVTRNIVKMINNAEKQMKISNYNHIIVERSEN
jgi:hypothetical protein